MPRYGTECLFPRHLGYISNSVLEDSRLGMSHTKTLNVDGSSRDALGIFCNHGIVSRLARQNFSALITGDMESSTGLQSSNDNISRRLKALHATEAQNLIKMNRNILCTACQFQQMFVLSKIRVIEIEFNLEYCK